MTPTQVVQLESTIDARSAQSINDYEIEELIESIFDDNPGIRGTSLAELSFLLYDMQEDYGYSTYSAHDFMRVLKASFSYK